MVTLRFSDMSLKAGQAFKFKHPCFTGAPHSAT